MNAPHQVWAARLRGWGRYSVAAGSLVAAVVSVAAIASSYDISGSILFGIGVGFWIAVTVFALGTLDTALRGR